MRDPRARRARNCDPNNLSTLSPQQYNELEGVSPLLTNITLANAWLRELGAGAESAGVSVQRT